MIKIIRESHLCNQIELESEIISLQLLSETKILFYRKNNDKAQYYDVNLQKTLRQLDFDYSSDNQFILSQDETKLGVYHKVKQILIIYDMVNNQIRQFKKKFNYIGVFNNQIIGIFKLAALIVQFDGSYVKQILPTYLFKKPCHISLAGNRILIRKQFQIHLLRLNQIHGYELKLYIVLPKSQILEASIQLVKTGKNIYFMLAKRNIFYFFKNVNILKKINKHILPYFKFQKILTYSENRVCIRTDAFPDFLTYRQLNYKPFSVMRIEQIALQGLHNRQIVATNKYIIIWNENKFFFFLN